MLIRCAVSLCLTLLYLQGASGSELRDLITFDQTGAADEWKTVNDGVMGGRSIGRHRINSNKNLEFSGNLSLANNGGFASVRTRRRTLNLRSDDTLTLYVRGDGRRYSLNLYPSRRRTAFSYRALFDTLADEWAVVRVPLSRFQATSYGRSVVGTKLNPRDIDGLGILLGDKRPGAFQLEIASISVESTD